MKRAAVINDLSGIGKCSLTVALPIISAAGIETSVLPTAVLSTHTALPGFVFRELTEDILPITDHWNNLGIRFDAIYSGYLGSAKQLEYVSRFADIFKRQDNLLLIDPVMGDNGRLYKKFDNEFPAGMMEYCKKADIIIPNITEAAFLVDEKYYESSYSKEYIENLLLKLSALGPDQIILTGVSFNPEELGIACYDKVMHKTSFMFTERVEGHYHGTGDIFGSVLLAALMNGLPLYGAAGIALEFTFESIKRTKMAGTNANYGVNFEAGIPQLLDRLRP